MIKHTRNDDRKMECPNCGSRRIYYARIVMGYYCPDCHKIQWRDDNEEETPSEKPTPPYSKVKRGKVND